MTQLEVGDLVSCMQVDADGYATNTGMVIDTGVLDGMPFCEVLVEDKRTHVVIRTGTTEKAGPRPVRFLRMFSHWSASPDRRINPDATVPLRDPDGFINVLRIKQHVYKALQSAALSRDDQMFRLIGVASALLQSAAELTAEQNDASNARVDDFNRALAEKRAAREAAQ